MRNELLICASTFKPVLKSQTFAFPQPVKFARMFIIDITYLAPLPQIDAAMSDHMKFLNACYKNNLFIASGRKIPRTGGIILAIGSSKEAIEELMNQDPFVKLKLAEFKVTEFQTSQMSKEFRVVLEQRS